MDMVFVIDFRCLYNYGKIITSLSLGCCDAKRIISHVRSIRILIAVYLFLFILIDYLFNFICKIITKLANK